MLKAIRKYSQKLWFKIIFVLVLIGFAFVGFNTASIGSAQKAIKVKNDSISAVAFDNYIRQNAANMPTDIEQRKEFLNRLMQMQAVDLITKTAANELHIDVSDEMATKAIRSSEQFLTNGEFDEKVFNSILNARRMSAKRYIDTEKEQLKKDVFLEIYTSELPKAYSDLYENINDYFSQKLVVERVIIPNNFSASDIKTPSEDVLKNYFEENKEQFRVPEYRVANVYYLDINDVANNPNWVSEEDINKELERQQQELKSQNTKVELMFFLPIEDESKAKEAQEKLAAGSSISDLRGDVIDGSLIIESEFTLADAENSYPELKNKFTLENIGKTFAINILGEQKYVELVSVSEKQQNEMNIEEIKETAKQSLASKFFGATAYSPIKDKLNQLLGQGKPYADVKGELNGNIFDVEITRTGLNTNSEKNTAAYINEEVLETIFERKVDFPTDEVIFVNNGDGNLGFVAITVKEIKESYIPKFQEITDDIELAYKQAEIENSYQEYALSIAKEYTKVSDIKEHVAGSYAETAEVPRFSYKKSLETELGTKLTDSQLLEDLHLRLIDSTYIYEQVTNVIEDTDSDDAVDDIVAEISDQFESELLDALYNSLFEEWNVTYNKEVLNPYLKDF